MTDPTTALEEEVSDTAPCRTCASDGNIACPECDDDAEEACRACGGFRVIACPDC